MSARKLPNMLSDRYRNHHSPSRANGLQLKLKNGADVYENRGDCLIWNPLAPHFCATSGALQLTSRKALRERREILQNFSRIQICVVSFMYSRKVLFCTRKEICCKCKLYISSLGSGMFARDCQSSTQYV